MERFSPRIKYSRLTLPKSRGGIGLPDLRKYYTACHLTRIADWNIHTHKKSWIVLENALSPLPLHLLPWLPLKHRPQSIATHPLLYLSLLEFRKASTNGNLASVPGPLTTLRGNPAFSPGTPINFLQKEWPHEDVLVLHNYPDEKIVSLDKLREMSKTSSFSFWTYRQIRHFLETHISQTHWTKQLSPF